jgi:hypothetical protein
MVSGRHDDPDAAGFIFQDRGETGLLLEVAADGREPIGLRIDAASVRFSPGSRDTR